MRTKDEIVNSYNDKSLLKAKTEDVAALTEAFKLEVLIDIRDIISKSLDGLRADISSMIISGLHLRK